MTGALWFLAGIIFGTLTMHFTTQRELERQIAYWRDEYKRVRDDLWELMDRIKEARDA